MGVYVSDENGQLKKYSGAVRPSDKTSEDINAINSVLNKTEQVEVLYDKNNSSKDWGYSGGLQGGTTISGKDFSKYKYLKIYGKVYATFMFTLNLQTLSYYGFYSGGTSFYNENFNATGYIPFVDVSISSDKTSITRIDFGSTRNNDIIKYNLNTNSVITKIEGVY